MFALGPIAVIVGIALLLTAVVGVLVIVLVAAARRRGPEPAVTVGAPAGIGSDRLAADLADLTGLHRRGALSDEEFAAAKQHLLR